MSEELAGLLMMPGTRITALITAGALAPPTVAMQRHVQQTCTSTAINTLPTVLLHNLVNPIAATTTDIAREVAA